MLERYNDALNSLEKAIEINPNNAQFHAFKGYALLKLGRIDEAKKEYKKSLKIDPNNDNVKKALEAI